MRRFVAAVVSLILGGCIPIRVPISVQHRQVLYVVAVSEEGVRAGLQRAKEKLASAPERLPASHCGQGTCYSQRDVAKLIESVHADLRKSFPADAGALLAAVDEALAAAAAGLGSVKEIDGPRVVSWPVRTTDGYDSLAVRRTLARMADALEHFLSLSQLALTLNVQTDPADADFIMEIPNNAATRRQVKTNSMLPNVWRGRYTATVNKKGFKDAVHTIDLIQDGRTNVSCTLMPQSASADSVCHVR